MRKALIGILLTLCAGGTASSDPDPSRSSTHVLPLSVRALALLADAASRSSIVAALMDELERTDVVVYVTDMLPAASGLASVPASYLSFLSHDATLRYVLVRIDHWRVTPSDEIALLGHELQHALEVAAAPEVLDAGGLAKLYRRIGWEGQADRFETAAAKETGERVRSEVSRHASRKRSTPIATSP
jgi:hypothetical protein